MECLSSCLIDRCQSSRKGAAASIHLIVSELGKHCFDVIGADSLRTLYKALKMCQSSPNDDVTLHHCSLAIGSIDSVTKDLFLSDRKMEKKIFVLDPPH